MVKITPQLNIDATNFNEYHLYYLAKHSEMWCRRMHVAGSLIGIIGVVWGMIKMCPMTIATSAITGLAVCWAGDVLVQRITPTTFKHPYWSMKSNFKMVKAMLTGDQPM